MSKRSLSDTESSAKRQKVTAPSRVVFIKNLPLGSTENDISALVSPFGEIKQTLLVPPKTDSRKPSAYALVEFLDINSAIAFVNTYAQTVGSIGGNRFYVEYSDHREIVPNTSLQTNEHPRAVLLLTIKNCIFAVKIEALQSVFSLYGPVLRVIMFQKRDVQAFVEMSSVECAVRAKAELNGRNIYPNCCTLIIQYGSHDTLSVKYNNNTSRDFTNPSLPTGPTNTDTSTSSLQLQPQYGLGPHFQQQQQQQQQLHHHQMPMFPAVVIVSGYPENITCDKLQTLFGFYGDIQRVKILFNKKENALIQFANASGAENAIKFLNNFVFEGTTLKVAFSKYSNVSLPLPGKPGAEFTRDYTDLSIHRYAKTGSNTKYICEPSKVLHISSVPDEETEESIQKLFETHGKVNKVVLKSSSDQKGPFRMGYVEMESTDSAINALMELHLHRIGSVTLRISFTKTTL